MEDLAAAPQPTPSKLPKFPTTVTPLSKFLASVLFILLPFVGFYLGIKYEKATSSIPAEAPVVTPLPSQSPAINLPPEVNNTTLYYLKDKKLYKISPLTSSPTVFIDQVDTMPFPRIEKRLPIQKDMAPERTMT